MAVTWKKIAFVEDVAAQSVMGNPTGSAAAASAITVAEQTLVGRITGGNVDDLSIAQVQTLLGIGGLDTALIGYLAGLVPSKKDDDEVYISGGSIEINKVVYNSDERVAIAPGGEPTGYGSDVSGTGTMTASSAPYVGDEAYRANDDNNDTKVYIAPPYPMWLKFDAGAGNKVTVVKYTIHPKSGLSPKAWTFEGSDDGTNWTVLDTRTSIPAFSTKTEFTVTIVGQYRYFRWNISAGEDIAISIEEIELLPPIYTLNSSTTYYIYVDTPISGTELAVDNFILRATAPSFDSAKGGYYHPTYTDERAIAYFTTDGDGYIPEIFNMYLSGALDGTSGTSGTDFLVCQIFS